VVIEQAKGVISERAGVDLGEAFAGCGATPATATSANRAIPEANEAERRRQVGAYADQVHRNRAALA